MRSLVESRPQNEFSLTEDEVKNRTSKVDIEESNTEEAASSTKKKWKVRVKLRQSLKLLFFIISIVIFYNYYYLLLSYRKLSIQHVPCNLFLNFVHRLLRPKMTRKKE